MVQKKQIKPVPQKHQKQKPPLLPAYKPNIWFALVSALVGFFLYANTIKHEYVLDDVGAITGNEFVLEGISGIPKILNVGMWHFDNVNLGYYRPLSLITFAIENELFPKNPHVSHLGNVILFALTGFFLCLLLMNLFRNFHPVCFAGPPSQSGALFSFIVTLLFLAHPIHTEVVANIKSRDEILAFLNLIIALFILLRTSAPPGYTNSLPFGKGWGWVLSCLFFYLALLSKETAMTGLFIAPLVLFFTCSLSVRQCLLRMLPFLLVVLIFQWHKYQVLGTVTGVIPKDIVNYPYTEAGTKLPSTFIIFLHCLRLLVFPHPLSYDYSYNQIPAEGFDSIKVWLGLLLSAALVYFCLKGLLKKSTYAFGVLFFCITLAPAMAFVFLRGGILAERFLYAPSLGFCIAIVWLFKPIPVPSPREGGIKSPSLWEVPMAIGIRMGFLFFLFLLYSFKTVTRNLVWHDNMTLFSTDVNASPNSCQVRRHYGSELINNGISEKNPAQKTEWFYQGVEQLKIAIRINPHFGDAFFKLGVAYQTVKVNLDSAIFYYTRAIQEAPGYAVSYNNLGILYEGIGKQELASYYYNKAVEANPFFPDGKRNSESHKKRYGLDVHLYPTSLNLDSVIQTTPENKRDFGFYYSLGTNYASKGDYLSASKCLEKAVQMNPNAEDALVNLSNCYGYLKNYNRNIEILNKVLLLNPNNAQALGNLAITYELLGDKKRAEEYREQVRKLTGK